MKFKGLKFVLALTMATPAPLALAEQFTATEGPLTVNIASASGFSSADKDKLAAAVEVLGRVLNGEEFRERVINYMFEGKRQFSSNDGVTNEEVFQRIMMGRETYTNEDDQQVDLSLQLYKPPFWKKWSVVGYTYPDTPTIYMNRNYYNTFAPNQVAANLAHEWCHKIGFGHDFNRTARRPYSVPYAVGDIVEELGARLP